MEDPEPFNSSDLEFSPPPARKYQNAGAASIASMRESLFEDRIASKKRVRYLTDTRGAPSTIYNRDLWRNRFQSYVDSAKIVVDPTTGPDITTFLRFLDTIVKHMQARGHQGDAPLRISFLQGIRTCISAFTFDYPKFTLSKNECSRIDGLVSGLAAEGSLTRGRRREKYYWIGASMVEKMSRAWFQAALDDGCLSWDITIHKALMVVLQSALACRSGDMTKSRGYTEEFMRWGDINMKLAPGDDSLDGVQLTCIIKFEKGHKDEPNDDRDAPLPTLKDPALNIVCPVKLLLIQALRSGNISSLEDALLQASSRGDRTIQWLYPQRPVFPQQQRNSGILNWDLPAPTEQVTKAVHQLGLVAGILANIISHDIRRGSLRDVANLKPSYVTQSGVATKVVAQTAGHSATSYANGTTTKYVGELEHETWSARVHQKFEGRKAPVIGSAFKKRRLTPAEIDSYCEEKCIDPRSSNGRRKAGAELHRKMEQDWIKDQRAHSSTPSKPPGGPGGAPTTVVTPFSAPAPSPQEWTPSIGSTTPSSNARTTNPPASASTPTTSPPTTSALATPEPAVPIDPRLLLLDGGDVPVDHNAAERLVTLACNTAKAPTEDDQEMALQILLDNVQVTSESILTLPGSQFVDALSKINVIRCVRLQNKGLKKIHENLPTFSAMGHSRDYPTLYTYTCQVCKEYTSQLDSVLQSHLRSCKGAKEKKEQNFKCDHEGCGKSFGTLKSLQKHVDGVHLFESQKCPESGCHRDEVFTTKDGLTNHLDQFHRPIDPPVRCSFAECQSQTLWAQIHNLQEHLRKVHKLSSMKQINPYLPTNTSRPSLVIPYHPRSCPLGGSSACSGIFKSLTGLVRHLVSEKGVHGLKYDEAKVTATRAGNNGGEGSAFLSEERVGDEEDDDIDG